MVRCWLQTLGAGAGAHLEGVRAGGDDERLVIVLRHASSRRGLEGVVGEEVTCLRYTCHTWQQGCGGGYLLDEAGVQGGVELERGAVGVGEVAQRAADHLLLLGVEVLEDVVPVININIITIIISAMMYLPPKMMRGIGNTFTKSASMWSVPNRAACCLASLECPQ